MNCPLSDCELQANRSRPTTGADVFLIDCPNCGRFVVSGSLLASSEFADHSELMEGLRAYIRQENEGEREPVLGRSDWQQRAREHRTSFFDRLG